MKITIQRDNRFQGVYSIRCGRRRAMLSVPALNVTLGIQPSARDVIAALNDTSSPGDKLIPETATLVFAN
jgi:hypothetical protein